MTARNCSGVSRVAGTAEPTLALLTRTSTPPSELMAATTTEVQSLGSLMSARRDRGIGTGRALWAWRASFPISGQRVGDAGAAVVRPVGQSMDRQGKQRVPGVRGRSSWRHGCGRTRASS
jgi:hypothetical protein